MNQQAKHDKQAGFTLIELSLAMAFIAMLLLGIAFLTIQISSVYNKGLTIRAVNEAGQLIASDIQRTLSASRPLDVTFVNITDVVGGNGGRLCANNVVYAWNYPDTHNSLVNGFRGYNTITGREVRFVRFIGDDSYCQLVNPAVPNVYKTLNTAAVTSNLTELLKSGDSTLAVHSFGVAKDVDGNIGQSVAGDGTQRMYQVSFVLGSNDTALITKNGCDVPVSNVDDEYCAVNEFNFTARAGNKGVSDVYNN